MGTVVLPPTEMPEEKIVAPLKGIVRLATKEDEEHEQKNREKEAEAFVICKQKIDKHKLEMKLIAAEYTFDRNKLLFYFTADGRIDFRELVKDLASVFRTRIELRQIGVRDETKLQRRNRYLRKGTLLSHLSFRICAGFHQNGKRAESVTQSDEDFGSVWPFDVLSEK